MRILFSSTRGTGHLEPLLPYAKALRARGHEVLVAGPVDIREPLERAGLSHAPFDHPGDDKLGPLWAQLRNIPIEASTDFVVREIFAGINSKTALPGVLETLRDFRPNLVVRDSVEFGSAVAAQVRDVPCVRIGVHQRMMEDRLVELATAPVDALRVAAGLDADNGAALRREPVFTAFPASFEGLPASGPAPFRIGPNKTAAATSASWQPEANDKPLIYITFGTVATQTPEALPAYRTAVAAIADMNVHALLTTGRGFDKSTLPALPANLRVEEFVPQAEVLPHAAVMVCHGGSGTLLGGLAAGVPQVIVPLFADQPQNAERIAAIGAGLALAKPEPQALRAAIERVIAEPAFREVARSIAREMAALPSADDAVEALLALAR